MVLTYEEDTTAVHQTQTDSNTDTEREHDRRDNPMHLNSNKQYTPL